MGQRPETSTANAAAPRVRFHGYLELNRSVALAALTARYPVANWKAADLSAKVCTNFIEALCSECEEWGVTRQDRINCS